MAGDEADAGELEEEAADAGAGGADACDELDGL